MNRSGIAITLLFLLPGLPLRALADEHGRGHEHRGERHGEWRGDIGHFRDHDIDRWRGGRWHRGWHDGRQGWWWILGGAWYYYPTRILPYPDPYLPPEYVEAAPAGNAPYWYYCANPAGYYPYVPRCAVAWQAVAPTLPPAAPLLPPPH
jgi:hypothetical protein